MSPMALLLLPLILLFDVVVGSIGCNFKPIFFKNPPNAVFAFNPATSPFPRTYALSLLFEITKHGTGNPPNPYITCGSLVLVTHGFGVCVSGATNVPCCAISLAHLSNVKALFFCDASCTKMTAFMSLKNAARSSLNWS